jgi:ketosteroid isomerase-like protein
MRIVQSVSPSSDDQAVVLSFFDALPEGREALERVFSADATWTVWGDLPFSGVHRGRRAVLDDFHAVAGRLFDLDADGVLEVTGLIGEGPVVAAEFNYRTRTAIGRTYHNHYVEVFEVEDGLIKRVREYMDTNHLRSVCFEGDA